MDRPTPITWTWLATSSAPEKPRDSNKRLVYDDQIATSANAFVDLREIGGEFYIQATARPGQNLDQVEKEVDEELARFLQDGPSAEELRRVKTGYMANFVRGIERIGGF